MKKDKIIPYAVFTSIILLCIYTLFTRNREIDAINTKGVEVAAVITKVIFARGFNIDFAYKYKGNFYRNHGNTAEFTCAVGDSILIAFLPEKPNGAFVLKSKIQRKHS
jgi:hypothetical protein